MLIVFRNAALYWFRNHCSSLRWRPFVAAILMPLVNGCYSTSPPSTEHLERFEFQSPHMGTMFSITLYAAEKNAAQTAADAAFRRVAVLEDIMSDYQADSELMRLCDQPPGKPVPVSAELFDILQKSQKFSQLTDGAFDVTVGPLVRLWRFSRKRKVLPTPAEVRNAQQSVGWKKYSLDPKTRTVTLNAPNMRLDLGGIGKGYAADEALAVLRSKGFTHALVAASGDIAVGDAPPGEHGWKVEIAALDRSGKKGASMMLLNNAGTSTSGDSEQWVEINGVRYSHIVDPATGLGLTNTIQVTIVAPNATTTDGLDTGISVLGAERGMALVNSLPKVSALILTRSQDQTQTFYSKNFKSLLYRQDGER